MVLLAVEVEREAEAKPDVIIGDMVGSPRGWVPSGAEKEGEPGGTPSAKNEEEKKSGG